VRDRSTAFSKLRSFVEGVGLLTSLASIIHHNELPTATKLGHPWTIKLKLLFLLLST
jgi:hypothetical protein